MIEMHELICDIVHAETEERAIQEAYRVFSSHCGITTQDEEGNPTFFRFDYFLMYDRDSIKAARAQNYQMIFKKRK